MTRMRLAVASISALVLLPLAACGDDDPDDGSDGSDGSGGSGGDHVAEALAVVPATADFVQVVDRAAMAARLGVTDAEPDEYARAVTGDAVGGTELAVYLRTMADGAAFDERDVRWSVSGTVRDGGTFAVYRVDDEVDLDRVGDDLAESGRQEDEVQGRRHLSGLPTTGDSAYPPALLDVYLDPERHLVVTGVAGPEVLTTASGDAESAGGSGVFDVLLDDAGDVELAMFSVPGRCTGVGGAIGRQMTPERAAALAEQLEGLLPPVATAFLATTDGDGVDEVVRLQHADDDAAEQDLEARRTYLEEGAMIGTGEPFAEIGSAELERDGAVVHADLDLDRPGTGRLLAQNGDGPFVC